MRRKSLLLAAALVLVFAFGAGAVEKSAAEAKCELGEMVVTATKVENYQAEIGSSVTVITADDLKKSGKTILLEVLRDVPGLSIVQYGTFGGGASIYMRGTKSGHTLVMLDGIELNDTMLTDGSVDIAHLLVDNIDRIEVVRGAQSTLYGSDAMGGVINIITKKGAGETKLEASFEGGSHNTFTEKAGVSGSHDKLSYSLSAIRLDSEGISKAVGGTEDDGYANTTLSARMGYAISDNLELDVVFRNVDSEYDYDDGANQDDPNKVGSWDKFAGQISLDHMVNSFWDHKITVAYDKTERSYEDKADAVDTTENAFNWYDSEKRKFEWQHNLSPVDWTQLTAGVEYEEEVGSGGGLKTWNVFEEASMDNKAYYFQSQFKFFDALFITPGVRLDDNSRFDDETTYKVSASYLIKSTDTRFKANWGTGFKAPSLYQLFSANYGDPTLKPDEGETYDVGVEQGFFQKRVVFGVTYFNNDFENMVEWNSATWKYGNIDNAEMEGWEIECSVKPLETLTLKANYTYTTTEDRDTGKELARRPQDQAAFSVDWAFVEKANVNISASYVGERWDNEANTTLLDAYTTVDFAASYDLTENFQVFGRAENLFNKAFEQISGYAGTDAAYYGGVKASF